MLLRVISFLRSQGSTIASPRRRFSDVPSQLKEHMNWSTSVLTGLSSDTVPSILFTFDNAKYIFNAGQNTNRAFLQSKQNWRKTRSIFFSQIGTKNTTGLPGIMMSFADASVNSLDIIGPPGLLHYLASMRMYTFRNTILVTPTEVPWDAPPDPIYKDENITVFSITAVPTSESDVPSHEPEEGKPVGENHTLELPLKRKRESSPESPQKRRSNFRSERTISESLVSIMNEPDFSPTDLKGDLAQEWRKLMVDTMFPATHLPVQKPVHEPKLKMQKKQGKKGKGKEDSSKLSSTKEVVAKASPDSEPIPLPKPSASLGSTQPSTDMAISTGMNSSKSAGQSTSYTPPSDEYGRFRARVPSGFHKQLPKFTPTYGCGPSTSTPALSYVIIGPRIRGKFNVEKAADLGLTGKNTHLRRHLTAGKAVTFNVEENGMTVEKTVRPEDCIGESEPPAVVIILDVPSPAHIPSLVASFRDSPVYRQFRSQAPKETSNYSVRSVYHVCGEGVLDSDEYTAFMNGFASDTHHIISSPELSSNTVTFTSVAYNQLKLNQLDSKMFPVPYYKLEPKKSLSDIPNLPANSLLMSPNLKTVLRPQAPPSVPSFEEAEDRFHPAVNGQRPLVLSDCTTESFSSVLEKVETAKRVRPTKTGPGADVGVLPLGTASALPSKYRNVSSTLIQIPNWGNILLDAGEGTWGQLVRNFSEDEASPNNVMQVLRDLKCIFISHTHGDHHMGLTEILAKRRTLDPPPKEPVYLITVRAVHLYVREFSDLQDLGLDDPSGNGVIPIMSEALHYRKTGSYLTTGIWQIGGNESWTNYQLSLTNALNMCFSLGLSSFSTIDVYHRVRCYGACIKHKDGWSVVFSGDTMPTDNLIWAGRNATLLIHEATMADDQAEMAAKKSHSTMGQAIDIGTRMNAENILLTHFSARYPKMPPGLIGSPKEVPPPLNTEDPSTEMIPKGTTVIPLRSVKKQPTIALAFDHVNLTIGDMWKLNHYLPAIKCSFDETGKEIGDEEEDSEPVSMDVDIF